MKRSPDEQALRYLLGELPPEEEEAIDERLLRDDEAALELELAEAELHELHARGELSRERRAAFEERFLARPGQKLRAAVTRGLVERARALPVKPRAPFWKRAWLPAGLFFAAVAAAAFLFLAPRRGAGPTVAALVEVELPAVSRGATVPVIGRPHEVTTLRLRPEIDDAAGRASFRLTLTRAGTPVIGPVDRGEPVLEVPGKLISAGLYTLRVEGARAGGDFDDLGFFQLRVE